MVRCRSALLRASVLVPALGAASALRNITVYHINEPSAGAVPLNMDSGDATGDMFFDAHNVIIYPLECPQGPATPGAGKCANAETFGDLVVSKVTLEVVEPLSAYAKCNVCVNGTDGYGHPCIDGEYFCFCDGDVSGGCNTTVGFENVSAYFSRGGFNACTSETECWRSNVVRKLGGNDYFGAWFSSLSTGCADPLHPTSNCTWRVVSVDAVVNRTCHTQTFFDAVAQYNQSCFGACSTPANYSDACHSTCFYQTALGPEGGLPNGNVSSVTGIPTNELVEAWLSAFQEESAGGCPRLPQVRVVGDANKKPLAAQKLQRWR